MVKIQRRDLRKQGFRVLRVLFEQLLHIPITHTQQYTTNMQWNLGHIFVQLLEQPQYGNTAYNNNRLEHGIIQGYEYNFII